MARDAIGPYLARQRERVDAAMRRSLAGLRDTVPGEVFRAVAYGALGDGKRLRPILVVAASDAMDAAITDDLYDLAAAVELLHAYSLIHDDLPCMDDAVLRRGHPAVHSVHGVPAAVLAGAVLIPWAAARALDAARASGRTASEASRIVACLLEAVGASGMIGGQVLDLLGEGRFLPERELEKLHRLKTGRLVAASLEIGALAVNAPVESRVAVHRFGVRLGLAFQVMDDVLDATLSTEALGKQPSDVRQGKSTYVTLLGVVRARARAETLVARALGELDEAGLRASRLRQLAGFVLERRR